ncbi:MAG: long-chain fatty acid transporter [Robiginitomaculum sp.]|nr:MAG: long-chain fatty acid transporter [Robiginitomaculum sp.]
MSIKIKSNIFVIIATITSINSYGAGFQVSEHSGAGLGRAFSGEAAIADTAAVLANNPAAMTRFDRAEVSGSFTAIMPSIDVNDESYGQKASNIAPNAYVPAAYYIQPINERLAVGLGLFSSYGIGTDYPEDFNAGLAAGKTSLTTFNLNPNVAYKINEQLSIGAGVSLVYGTAELNRRWGGDVTPEELVMEMEGDSYSWGWNVGTLYEVNENNRFALSYRSQVDMDFEGDFTDHTGTIVDNNKGHAVTGELPVVLPAIAEFAGFHQLNSQWSMHYSIQWTQYSQFKELAATSSQCKASGEDGICFYKDEDYKDTFRFALGGSYTVSPKWILRAGVAYDQRAGQSTLSIPDTDRYWYSAGASYVFNDDLSIDLGITYLQSAEASFEEEISPSNPDDGTMHSFTSTGNALLGSAQVNYKF